MLPFFESFRKRDVPKKLSDEIFNSSGAKIAAIENLNKVNIFVGPNNSGKSLLLREMLKTKSHSYYGPDKWAEIIDHLEIFKFIESALNRVMKTSNLSIISDSHEGEIINLDNLKQIYTQVSKYTQDYDVQTAAGFLYATFDRTFAFNTQHSYSYYTSPGRIQSYLSNNTDADRLTQLFSCLNEIKEKVRAIGSKLNELKITNASVEHPLIYIPTFRSLKAFNNLQISDSITKEYEFQQNVKVYTGQHFPNAIDTHKANTHDYRRKIDAYEEFLSKTFFQNKKVVLTFHRSTGILLVKIGNEKDRFIYELGDGLQMLIVLTFPFFEYEWEQL